MTSQARRSLAVVSVIVSVLAAGCGSSSSTASSAQSSASTAQSSASTSVSASTSTTVLATALTAAYRSETAAQATYRNVVDRLGRIRPFVNVLDAEQQHVATVRSLMVAHGVPVPAAAPGTASPGTIALACDLGVRTEQNVISLYDRYLPQISAYPDLVRVFDSLRSVSAGSHLPAFQRC